MQCTMCGREARRSKIERDRIRKDEEIKEENADLDRMRLRAEFESRGLDLYEKDLKRRERTLQREMKLWNISLTMVRREALRRLLEQEKQLHIRELNKIGLTIYQQRI